jgi:hypothetical protein
MADKLAKAEPMFPIHLQCNTLNTTKSPAEKVAAPRKTQTGIVSTQAKIIFRSVAICRPDRLAAIVPAMPEESTWVVLTGKP